MSPDLDKIGKRCQTVVSLGIKSDRHSPNLFMVLVEVLNHWSLSYPVLGRSALPQGLTGASARLLIPSTSVQDVRIHIVISSCGVMQFRFVIEYEIHQRLRNVS